MICLQGNVFKFPCPILEFYVLGFRIRVRVWAHTICANFTNVSEPRLRQMDVDGCVND